MLHTKPQVEILPRPQVSSLTAELTLNGVDLPSDSLAIQCLPTCTCTHQTKLHGHVCCICVHPVGRDRARARLFNVWHTQILPPRGIATQWIFSTWTSINLVRCVCVCVSHASSASPQEVQVQLSWVCRCETSRSAEGGKLRVGMRKCVLIEEPLFVRLKLQAWTQPPHQSLLHDASSTASSTRGFYSRLISSSSYPPRPRGVFLGIFRRRAVGPEDFIVRFQYIK